MIVEIFVACTLYCCTHIFSYDYQWLEADVQSLKWARATCQTQYPTNPCLTKLVKKEPQVFNATCGKNNEK